MWLQEEEEDANVSRAEIQPSSNLETCKKEEEGTQIINLTYKADFGFSVFMKRLKNQKVSEGPVVPNERKCCRDGLGNKKDQLSET